MNLKEYDIRDNLTHFFDENVEYKLPTVNSDYFIFYESDLDVDSYDVEEFSEQELTLFEELLEMIKENCELKTDFLYHIYQDDLCERVFQDYINKAV